MSSGSRGPRAGGLRTRRSGLDTPGRAGWWEVRGGGALAPPASPTVTKAGPPPPPRRDSTRLCPPGHPFSAGPWKRPRQRLPLSGPRPAVLRLDKAGPFIAARADRTIQCLDNSTTKSLWPLRLHQLGAAPPPLGPFRTLGRENSHRPQRQARALEKQRLWPPTPAAKSPRCPEAWGVFPPLPAPAAHLVKG